MYFENRENEDSKININALVENNVIFFFILMMTGFLANPVFRSVDAEFSSHKTTKEAQLFEFDSEPWDVISAVSQRSAFSHFISAESA